MVDISVRMVLSDDDFQMPKIKRNVYDYAYVSRIFRPIREDVRASVFQFCARMLHRYGGVVWE